MAKKDYRQGLAGLLTPTVEETKTKEVSQTKVMVENEKTEGLYVTPIPSELKRRMDVYCAEHRIKKHVFVTEAIRWYLDQ
jgi:hypothetical protein